jgi:hypothetical protein
MLFMAAADTACWALSLPGDTFCWLHWNQPHPHPHACIIQFTQEFEGRPWADLGLFPLWLLHSSCSDRLLPESWQPLPLRGHCFQGKLKGSDPTHCRSHFKVTVLGFSCFWILAFTVVSRIYRRARHFSIANPPEMEFLRLYSKLKRSIIFYKPLARN